MRYGPGKFEACGNYSKVARWLYYVDATPEESLGESDSFGWYSYFSGKIKGRGPFHFIISEDSQGFVTLGSFNTKEDLDSMWQDLEADYEKFNMEEDNEEN